MKCLIPVSGAELMLMAVRAVIHLQQQNVSLNALDEQMHELFRPTANRFDEVHA